MKQCDKETRWGLKAQSRVKVTWRGVREHHCIRAGHLGEYGIWYKRGTPRKIWMSHFSLPEIWHLTVALISTWPFSPTQRGVQEVGQGSTLACKSVSPGELLEYVSVWVFSHNPLNLGLCGWAPTIPKCAIESGITDFRGNTGFSNWNGKFRTYNNSGNRILNAFSLRTHLTCPKFWIPHFLSGISWWKSNQICTLLPFHVLFFPLLLIQSRKSWQ